MFFLTNNISRDLSLTSVLMEIGDLLRQPRFDTSPLLHWQCVKYLTLQIQIIFCSPDFSFHFIRLHTIIYACIIEKNMEDWQDTLWAQRYRMYTMVYFVIVKYRQTNNSMATQTIQQSDFCMGRIICPRVASNKTVTLYILTMHLHLYCPEFPFLRWWFWQ